MLYPQILEQLILERSRDMAREAERMHLLASLRPPRRGWREQVGNGMQSVGGQLANWGYRLANAQAACEASEVVAVPVRLR